MVPVARGLALLLCLLWPGLRMAPVAMAAEQAKILSVSGPAAKAPVELSLEEIEGLGMTTMTTTTPWHPQPTRFAGVLASVLVDRFTPQATTLEMTALNDYKVEAKVDDLQRYEALFVTRINGEPMKVRDRGPVWLLFPYDEFPEVRTPEYVASMIWQLKEIVAK